MPQVYQYIIEEIMRGNIYSAYVINIKLMNPISIYIADVCAIKNNLVINFPLDSL